MPVLRQIKAELSKLADPRRAKASAWFFKTGPGQYGEGDIFIGIRVPTLRQLALRYRDLPLPEIKELLHSKVHEHRFVALEILVAKYEHGNQATKKQVAHFYLKHSKQANNWDLVDTSAPYILGDFLYDKQKDTLYTLANSKNIWQRRIAIVATAGFIKKGLYRETTKIARMLLRDSHDLIHKATGWMLREIGKRSLAAELSFLDRFADKMPRTMLRYAIEKLPPKQRRHYLSKKVEKR